MSEMLAIGPHIERVSKQLLQQYVITVCKKYHFHQYEKISYL